MVTACLPCLTDDGVEGGKEVKATEEEGEEEEEAREEDGEEVEGSRDAHEDGNASGGENGRGGGQTGRNKNRNSVAMSLESDVTITPEIFTRSQSNRRGSSASQGYRRGQRSAAADDSNRRGRKPSALAGYVGLFTGCGALVALALFLPLPAQFSKREGVSPAQAIIDSFYVVGAVALVVAAFVFFGLRGLKGEEGKGWRMLLGLRRRGSRTPAPHFYYTSTSTSDPSSSSPSSTRNHGRPADPLPYTALLLSSLRLALHDPHIALGYLGGFVARASTVAISLFIPLYVNAFYISQGFCAGSPSDGQNNPEFKKECRAAYVLASILSGVAQLCALFAAPLFGYVSSRSFVRGFPHVGVAVGAAFGIVGYAVFPRLSSPEFSDVEGRGGGAGVFLVVALLGISQIGAIVCSLGSLGRGVLGADVLVSTGDAGEAENGETAALLENGHGYGSGNGDEGSGRDEKGYRLVPRVQLKGSVAGVYSWCGGVAILLLTKLGGYMFDVVSRGAPFYMMAVFNGVLLVACVGIDVGGRIRRRREGLGG
ncbi:hypothetical protein F5Y15DRAFT_388313 [Xylariaceae sp. FL0016]|nr:hypothetical protein F5Y15DRAFT_388313 [Xylariaceae sp. FL0016]